jgi:hypothetical protein
MNLCIEHDAATLARMTGSPKPACDGLIMPLGNPGEVVALTLRSNPLGESWLFDAEMPGERIVAWSGTLAEDLLERHPMNWMPAGNEAFRAFCAELRPQLETHQRKLCFQPHSRHVLSDVPSCLTFLRSMGDSPFEIALATASLLEPEMLKDVDDHLRRAFESLGGCCAMVMLNDVVARPHDDDARCEAVALGDGVLPRELIRQLVRDHVPPQTPIVISPAKLEQQQAWLRE